MAPVQSVTLTPGNRTAIYKFTAGAGQKLYFDNVSGSTDPYARLIDPSRDFDGPGDVLGPADQATEPEVLDAPAMPDLVEELGHDDDGDAGRQGRGAAVAARAGELSEPVRLARPVIRPSRAPGPNRAPM